MSRIIVVEDEPGVAFALEVDLKTEGYEVMVATRGDDALELIRSEPFDLILLDVMLPGKDGFDVCRDLRRSGVRTADYSADGEGAGGREGARPRAGR